MSCRPRLARVVSLLTIVLVTALVAAPAAQGPVPVPGRNANLASGPAELDLSVSPPRIRGDFLLKQDNEGSCTFGSRSRKNILCGGNDYGLVEVPGIDPEDVVRDAGAGVYQSADGGDTWESTMLPGHVLDTGSNSLLRNYTAFADITTRSGAAGIAYMTGIAFKSFNNTSIGYLATFLELTNKENDRMPFKHLYTVKFDSVPETLIEDPTKVTAFIDKPWSVVLPPTGATCTIQAPGIPRQVIPDSPVVIGYTIFANLEKGENLMTSLEMIVKVTNCGRKVSKPRLVSLGHRQNGISLAVSPVGNSKRVVAVWRRFASKIGFLSFPDAIFAVVSNDAGSTWSLPRQVAAICPFQQASTWATARVNTFPTVAIDHTGRIAVAWSDRGRDASGACNPAGQSRIVLSTSSTGASWTPPTIVDRGGIVKDGNAERMVGHQITPSLTYGGRTLLLLWKDLRETKANYFDEFINEFPLLKAAFGDPVPAPAPVVPGPPFFHHTIELYSKMANVGSALAWGESRRVSQYKMGKSAGESVASQKQWDVLDLQLFARGTRIFDGDYADGAGPPLLPPDPKAGRLKWLPDTGQGGDPMFFGVWASNRDVHRVPQHTDPTGPDPNNPGATAIPYTPPALTSPLRNYAAGPYPQGVEFTPCTPGAGDFTKTMDQNLYGARIGRGLFAFSPGNNKQINTETQIEKGSNFQRAFVVTVRNDAAVERTFDLTIPFQPDGGGFISFTQFPTPPAIFPQLTQRVTVAPKSSVSRSVFIVPDDNPATPPLDPRTRARVDITEVNGTGQTASVYFNPDPSAPEIEAPEIEAKEIYTPEIEAAQITVHSTAAPEIEAPEIEAPEIEAPEIEAPEIEAKSFQTPEIEATNVSAPEIEAPEIEAPEIEATPVTTDVTWPVSNAGNTTAGYVVRPFVDGDLTPFHFQLVASRIVQLPTAKDCQPAFATMNKVSVNIRNANQLVDRNAQISPEDLQNATIWVAPGETVLITLRVRGAVPFNPALNPTTLTVAQQAIDTDDLVAGIRVPTVVTSDLGSPSVAFVAQPSDTVSGAVMQPPVQVLVQDDGEPVQGATVTLSLRGAPLGTALGGTAIAVTGADGRATFNNLIVNGLASGLRLVAAVGFGAGDVRRVTSGEFDVRILDQSFVVTTNADAGEGSLRSAILSANSNPGLDAITFAMTEGSTIDLSSPLPAIVDPVIIDGTTQPNEGPGTVRLNGFDAGEGSTGLRFTCAFEPVRRCAGGSVVRGMVIRGFGGNGIELLNEGGARTRVIGNVLSGNGGNGLVISGTQAAGNVVQGNQIGGNGFEGSNGNSGNGVHIDDAPANLIGGETPQARNVISANGGEGVRIDGEGDTASSNVIQGNYIGTSLDGLTDVGNALSGVFVVGARSTSILGNVVAGNNGFAGIAICGSATCGGGANSGDAIGTVIQGNRVGVNAAGAQLGNAGYGISLDGMSDSLVGGSSQTAANIVAFNGSHGVIVFNAPAAGNQILGNSIHSNTGLGIDLQGNDGAGGVTPNDTTDADTGSNDLQNFPLLDSAVATSPTALNVTGSLRSTSGQQFRIQVFLNSSCDPSGNGEGQLLIGSFLVNDDDNDGVINFTRALKRENDWQFVTATATRQGETRSTSEFGPCRSITGDVPPGVELAGSDSQVEDEYGRAVAVGGGFMIVGAPEHDGGRGAVYVFQEIGGEWTQVQKLVAADGAINDGFGHSVAISNARIAVGAPFRNSSRGAVYFFRHNETSWVPDGLAVVAADGQAGDELGISVAISGLRAVAGAVFNDHSELSNPGAAYVFERTEGWIQHAKLTAGEPQSDASFGISVAVAGERVAIGAHRDDNGESVDAGSVYILERNVDGQWQPEDTVVADDLAAGDAFGTSVSLSGDVLVVGAPMKDTGGTNTGSAYVFEPADGWIQQAKLNASNASGGNFFGVSVSISGTRIVVGASGGGAAATNGGSAYVFDNLTGLWSQQLRLTAPDEEPGHEFGWSVSVAGSLIGVGARFGDGNVLGSGSAYIFQ